MEWVKVLPEAELPQGGRKVVKVGQRSILLLYHEGKLHAVNSRCPHINLSLKRAKVLEDGSLVCPFHRSAFDLNSGEVKEWTTWPPVVGDVLGKISPPKPLPIFPTRLEEGHIWVGVEPA